MAGVRVQDLYVSFGSIEVLKGIDLEMLDGEFVVLVGPSGCGKSTLLRTIAGLESASKGDLYIGDTRVNELAPKDRDISMVFQSYALYPHMDVARNIGFGLEVRKQDSVKIDSAVNSAAELLGLAELKERRPKALSGGQRQRVAMGRAIVRKPKVFLFDEPLSNLDAKLRVQMRTEIKALHQKFKTTSIYVTHDQVEAMTMADRIVVLNGGIIQQCGPPLTLYDKPVNTFVASFLGSPSMNFLEGKICKTTRGFEFQNPQCKGLPVGNEYQHLSDAQKVVYGIRPESIQISSQASDASVPATTRLLEPTGLSTLLYIELGDANWCCFTMDRVQFAPGDAIHLEIDSEKVHLFDKASGQRLS